MKNTSLTLLLVLISIFWVFGTNPGIEIRVTNQGLAYADNIAIQVLIEKLKTTKINDLSGRADTPLGDIDYELTNLHNTGASIATSSFKTVPGVGLDLSASGVYVAFTGDWHYRKVHWPHVSDSGSFDISASGVSFSLTAKIGADKGRPSISTASCTDNVGDVNVKFHGGASWLYNLFKGKIADSIKSQLNSLICEEATKAINEDAEKELATFPVRKQLDKFSLIDYSLIEPPVFEEDYMGVDLKGELMSATHPTESTLIPPVIPANQTCTKMICFYVTDYVLNTAGQVYYKGNFFNTTVSSTQVPPSFKYQLNTNLLKILGLSKVYDMYPDRPLFLHLFCTEPPSMKTLPTGINIAITGNVEVYVVTKEEKHVFLFTLTANLTGSGSARVNGTILQGSVSKFSVDFGVFKSAVGDIKPNIGVMNLLLHLLAENTIIKELNEKGEKGIPLPVLDNVQLEDSAIKFGKNFFSFDTDLKYTGPRKIPKRILILA
ncbi:lipopolysaccharide-binding protein-like [Dendronephthya gigantea]|uniref:lipopolysaccharide-binding protein-like n=1 Tax=Dendronephthya gigantea TaxID=151771 RepID=UPI00106D17D6|nr:lipopolysaccharide-binding protein-like [Dendronephthya gigantea]